MSLAAACQRWLLQRWFRPQVQGAWHLLRPLAKLYGALERRSRRQRRAEAAQRAQPERPVLVVGNLVIGGAGKTPATITIVQALQAAGHRPGVVSRGFGRRDSQWVEVNLRSDPTAVGDEPLLIHRRTGAPVLVGRDRVAAAQELLRRHPQLDLVVADDGLQHRQLARQLEVLVFDERGIGNGQLLPLGPLREPMPLAPPAQALVLYTHDRPSTAWPGACAPRRLRGAWPLATWLTEPGAAPQPLANLRGQPLLAMAGIAVPERFFSGLEAAGLSITRLPLADHHDYRDVPWPPGTAAVITTEKDAVKLARWARQGPHIWVVGLDLVLPAAFVATLIARLPPPPSPASPGSPPSPPPPP